MIQRFIELGEGYSDLYELLAIGQANKERIAFLLALHTKKNEKEVVSLAIILKPTDPGNFQPIYICREGIPNPETIPNKRYDLFQDFANSIDRNIIRIDIKPSTLFSEKDLFYQHLIGILRMNRYLPPLS